ncbi:Tubulin polyglutamylase TTLL11 [Microtus ochrogaster]|uniref:Tubulin polyglutamylase TTLL11 n=1 Tax=Microtus ochrogaster TaxID=79684 RepID=A0A8J6KX49_MICOH|nr:Tubulin polyglutamylase TTLL11 [Microtus ochrogaster]
MELGNLQTRKPEQCGPTSMTEMVRKITLSRALRIMQNLFPDEYNFYPRSWILPEEFQLFVTEVRMVKDGDPTWKPTFIVKPESGCQGDGIYLIKDPNDIRMTGTLQNRPAVVQEYICKPLLIDKLKFDIRLYVLLKSLEPLEIYIAKDGLSRFCTEPYHEPNPQNLHHVFMHLTNYSLNIHSGKFVHSDSASTGSKRTFSSILCRLSSKGIDIKKVWSDIISLVIKTVIALTPELKVFYQSDIPTGRPGPTCFQLSPGVFENIPSLVDEEVKVAVIRDTLRLMNPLKKKKEMHTSCTSAPPYNPNLCSPRTSVHPTPPCTSAPPCTPHPVHPAPPCTPHPVHPAPPCTPHPVHPAPPYTRHLHTPLTFVHPAPPYTRHLHVPPHLRVPHTSVHPAPPYTPKIGHSAPPYTRHLVYLRTSVYPTPPCTPHLHTPLTFVHPAPPYTRHLVYLRTSVYPTLRAPRTFVHPAPRVPLHLRVPHTSVHPAPPCTLHLRTPWNL